MNAFLYRTLERPSEQNVQYAQCMCLYGEKLSWKIQIKVLIIINVLRHDALPELRKSEK